MTLVARRQQTSSAMPDFFEDIKIYHYNPATGRNTTYYPDELGKLNHDSILRGSISVYMYVYMYDGQDMNRKARQLSLYQIHLHGLHTCTNTMISYNGLQ